MALQPSHQRFTTSSAHDLTSPWEPHFSSSMSVVLLTLSGTPCFKVYFPLQPKLQHSQCHHRSPFSHSPEKLPQAMQQDLIAKIQNLATWSHQRAAPRGLYIQNSTFNPQWHTDAWLFYSRHLNSRSHTLICNMKVAQWLPSVVFWVPFPEKPTHGPSGQKFSISTCSWLPACAERPTQQCCPCSKEPEVKPRSQRSCYFLVSCSGLHIHIADVLVLEFVCTARRRWAFCTEHLLKVPAHHLSPLLNSSI